VCVYGLEIQIFYSFIDINFRLNAKLFPQTLSRFLRASRARTRIILALASRSVKSNLIGEKRDGGRTEKESVNVARHEVRKKEVRSEQGARGKRRRTRERGEERERERERESFVKSVGHARGGLLACSRSSIYLSIYLSIFRHIFRRGRLISRLKAAALRDTQERERERMTEGKMEEGKRGIARVREYVWNLYGLVSVAYVRARRRLDR